MMKNRKQINLGAIHKKNVITKNEKCDSQSENIKIYFMAGCECILNSY